MTFMFQKKGSALPIRLTDEEKTRLNQIANAVGLTPSTIIRLLVDALIRDYEQNGNSITLPISLQRMSASL